jgi:hypothetical protein
MVKRDFMGKAVIKLMLGGSGTKDGWVLRTTGF